MTTFYSILVALHAATLWPAYVLASRNWKRAALPCIALAISTVPAAIALYRCELEAPFDALLWASALVVVWLFLFHHFRTGLALGNADTELARVTRRHASLVRDQMALVCRFRADGTLTYVNDAYARFFNRDRKGLIGTNFMQLVPENEHASIRALLNESIRRRTKQSAVHQVIGPGHELCWMEWVDVPLFHPDGSFDEFQSMGVDVTERKRAELRAHTGEKQNAFVAELGRLALQGLDLTDLRRKIAYGIVDLCGADYSAIFDMDDGDLVLAQGCGYPAHCIGRLKLPIAPGSISSRAMDTTEAVLYSEISPWAEDLDEFMQQQSVRSALAVPLLGADSLRGLMLVFSERSGSFGADEIHFLKSVASILAIAEERRQVEQQLVSSESRFRNMVSHMPVLLAAVNDEFRITFWNSACVEATGYEAQELIGHPDGFSLLFPDAAYREYVFQFIQGLHGDYRDREFIVSRKDGGTRIIAWSSIAIAFPIEGWRSWAVGVDVTERKALEKELLQVSSREQRRIGRDLHDHIGQLLTGAGFTIARLKATLAENEREQREHVDASLDIIKEAIQQTRMIARGLNPINMDMERGFETALEELVDSTSRMYGIDCEFIDERDSIEMDKDVAVHLYRIAQEGISNAVRHGAAQHVRMSLSRRQGELLFQVEDSGRGFDPPRNGEGLGLRIMAHRASVMGGRLSIDRGQNGGTVLVCAVPEGLNEIERERAINR